jgi:hypothetical protein
MRGLGNMQRSETAYTTLDRNDSGFSDHDHGGFSFEGMVFEGIEVQFPFQVGSPEVKPQREKKASLGDV